MESEEMLREMYRLSLENNKMLHKMRRSAFWGGIIRFVIYAALIIAPIWFYMQYLSPVVDSMLQTVQQMQGTSVQAQTQFSQLQDAWKRFESTFKPSSAQ